VTDGTNIVTILHVNDTFVSLREGAPDYRDITGTIKGTEGPLSISSMYFLRIDPRILIVPVESTQAGALGVHIYPTALEPFKFPEAVLISGGGRFYGEVEFKLDAQTPGYVRMQSRVLSRLFGEFSPSAGDLVFSKTGELLGVMVNNSYCRLVDNFIPSAELPFGTGLLDRKTSEIFAAQRARVLRLPTRLQ
jgi:hypothetical protein